MEEINFLQVGLNHEVEQVKDFFNYVTREGIRCEIKLSPSGYTCYYGKSCTAEIKVASSLPIRVDNFKNLSLPDLGIGILRKKAVFGQGKSRAEYLVYLDQ